jgi:hypothetical protein
MVPKGTTGPESNLGKCRALSIPHPLPALGIPDRITLRIIEIEPIPPTLD